MAEITNAKMEALRLRLDAIENQKRLPMPTPEIGRIVWFYKQGNLDELPLAALVTSQDSPGQVSLELHPKLSQVHPHVTGVHHKDHPFVEQNPKVIKMAGHGVWDYRKGDKITEAHKELHMQALIRQEKSIREELMTEKESEIRRQQRESDLNADRASAKAKQDKVPATAS